MSQLTSNENEAAISAAVRDAAAAREPVLVTGGATKQSMLRPVQAARTLSTREHAGITLYAPKELIISVRAGTPLAEVQAALAQHGQHLISEPPDFSALLGQSGEPTIGGVVATNLSGPRRIAWGATRDHVMGVRAVTGWGEVIRSGGRVLKNVTGLDLCKLLSGSHGTLAVVTEVTLKVLPAPEASGTLVLPGLGTADAVAALSAALGAPYGVSGAAWLPPEAVARVPPLSHLNRAAALIRIEDFAKSVLYRTERLRQDLKADGAEILDDAASRVVWRAIRDAIPLAAEPADAVWRVSVRPSAGPAVLTGATEAGANGFLDWGGGLVWLAGPATHQVHQAIARAALAHGGHWTLMRGPEALRAAVDVVPPEPEALARITRRVKAALDPHGILNPGRIYAGL